MADLRGPVGTPRVQNGSKAAGGPVTVPVPGANPEVRMRSPRQVMRDRELRMAKKKQDEEEEQARVSAERRAVQEAAGVANVTGRNRYQERLSQSAQGPQDQRRSQTDNGRTPMGTLAQGSSQLNSNPGSVRKSGGQPQRSQPTTQPRARAASQPDQLRSGQSQPQRAASGTYPQQPQATQTRPDNSNPAGTTRAQAEPSASTQRPAAAAQQSTAQARPSNTSTFPHAFERWETLSSHWEGLTNFWIKRLQGNSDELSGQPLNQQLARQVTDLAAAGANLFHAVVELQRLRASSERKFQRWFFETREEHERNQERIAQLENELSEARRNQRTTTERPSGAVPEEALEQARKEARDRANEQIANIRRETELEIKEKNRELEISREEARRGWEEIGRMEQENRDRTFSLRRGEPTIVGGVQVVPMMAAGASRQTSTSRGHAGGGLSSHPPQSEGAGGAEAGYTGYDPSKSETDTDPFTESGRDASTAPMVPTSVPQQPPTSAAAMLTAGVASSPRARTPRDIFPPSNATYDIDQPVQAPTTSSFYQHGGAATALHRGEPGYANPGEADQRSYAESEGSLGEERYLADEHGNLIYDREGNPILAVRQAESEGSADYDVIEQLQRERVLAPFPGQGQYGGYAQTSNGSYSTPDYSGSGYGRDWEIPRHHHPTRLSDVPEEDERSRTSPSRASQRSRGVR